MRQVEKLPERKHDRARMNVPVMANKVLPNRPMKKWSNAMAKKTRQPKAAGKAKPAQKTEKRLAVDTIKCDRNVQPRVTTDKAVVKEYAERIKTKDNLPPVVVYFDGEQHWLAEGFHRLAAHEKAGRKQIDCIVYEGTKADAQWRAIQNNKDHGLRRTNEDKAKAVAMAFAHPKGKDMSDRGIADLVGVSPTMVAKYRPKAKLTAKDGQSKTRVGRDGRKINTAKIGKTKKARVKLSEKPEMKAGNKTPTPQVDHGVAEPAEVAVDVANDRLVEDVLHGKPLEVYRRVLENLPDALAELAKHADEIVGKATKPKVARKALARIWKSLKVFHDAETKLAEGST